MFNLYENIVALCAEKGMTRSKMCDLAGISKFTIQHLKGNPDATMTPRTAKKIADVLGVDVDIVLHGRPADTLTHEEQVLLSYFRAMTAESRQSILQISANLAALGEQKNNAVPDVETA